MKIQILAPRRTPEVECCEAYLRWHQIPFETSIAMKYLADCRGGGVPCIEMKFPDRMDMMWGFNSMYKAIVDAGRCLI